MYYPQGLTGKHTLYINYGRFEDTMLNKEWGFSDYDLLENQNYKLDEEQLFSKFNSRNSYIIYNKILHSRMRHMEESPMNFIYPESWGWMRESTQTSPTGYSETYNTHRGIIPNDRMDMIDKLSDVSVEGTDPYVENNHLIKDYDIKQNQIPLREIFISTEIIKSSLKVSKTPGQFLNNILKRINDDVDGSFNLQCLKVVWVI